METKSKEKIFYSERSQDLKIWPSGDFQQEVVQNTHDNLIHIFKSEPKFIVWGNNFPSICQRILRMIKDKIIEISYISQHFSIWISEKLESVNITKAGISKCNFWYKYVCILEIIVQNYF